MSNCVVAANRQQAEACREVLRKRGWFYAGDGFWLWALPRGRKSAVEVRVG